MVQARSEGQPALERGDTELRSLAQLKMLHTLAARLNRLNDVGQIGEAITAELRTLLDYHSCRVYLLQPDGRILIPIAFRGELTEYEDDTFEDLVTEVGEGITGRVAATGASFYAPNAVDVPWAVQIAGTPEIDESMLAVPLRYGDRTTGVIVLSSLGVDKFDDEDMRVLEVLASHAAVAFENARLLGLERESAQTATALLGLSQALTQLHATEEILRRTLESVPDLVATSGVQIYVRDPETRAFHLHAQEGFDEETRRERRLIPDVPPEVAAQFLLSVREPFILGRELITTIPEEVRGEAPLADVDVLVAPLRWEPDGFGAIVAVSLPGERFSERDLRLVGGIADISSLALGTARRFHELERFHELVEGLDAIFWEADAKTLQFTFLSHRAADILGTTLGDAESESRYWGDHIVPEDQEAMLRDLRLAAERGAEQGTDFQLEYRAPAPVVGTLWLRDMVHVVRADDGSPGQLRGLLVDITDRKRAEQALKRSEQTYSDAFRREREATHRLRALDEMKNMFLEAVSHELRTPLTSILGSALTLEQADGSLRPEDQRDLIVRIAANARKLQGLLGDLLDLDRLQRGILSPQRRPVDVAEVVHEAVRESDVLKDRSVEIDAEPLVVSVDPAKVERIVENLLANAARHTPPGTRVWVRVEPEGDGALVIVEDEGPGVPAENQEMIFEPFQQAGHPNHAPGVGVGLSLVAKFAELHGGRAWLQDRPGGGASFHVLLPGADPLDPDDAQAPASD
jgi:signal transduction histidine kinase/transcriptional regulator with GAF, ATPase, and Fis domain